MSVSTIRHAHIFDPLKHGVMCTVIGCGAIGSRIFEGLVSLGLTRIRAYDFDYVEPHNIANQIYSNNHTGIAKTAALEEWYHWKTGPNASKDVSFGFTKLPDPLYPVEGIVFLAVDSFAARREIAEACLFENPNVFYCFDFRMGALGGNVIGFNPCVTRDRNYWLTTLGSDDPDAAELSPCGTSLTVGPTAATIANLGVIEMITHLTNPEGQTPDLGIFLRPMMFNQTFNRKAQ